MIPWDAKKQAHSIISASIGEDGGGGDEGARLEEAAENVLAAIQSGDASAIDGAISELNRIYQGE
jgi:hypothetical protein